jgi:hypothetical protein
MMADTRYRFPEFFRAYERHVVNFPRGSAFRKQWNIGLNAGDNLDGDYVRIGVGFRLSPHESLGITEYLEFREEVRRKQAAFDRAFQSLGSYYEFLNRVPAGA